MKPMGDVVHAAQRALELLRVAELEQAVRVKYSPAVTMARCRWLT